MQRSRFLSPVLVFAAGAAMLAGALGARAQKPGDVGFPYGDLKEVTLQGRLVRLGDLLARKYGAKAAAGGEPQWALVLPEGQLYTFLENETGRKLLASPPPGGAVEVRARLFPRSMLLEVTGFRGIPEETLRRRFHCGVCNITTEEFGPCACCGKEMEPVKEP